VAFDEAAANLNASMLAAFGESFIFTPAAAPSTPVSITGIMESGSELEEDAPGDGSIYARLWVKSSDFSTAPVAGDEVASASTVYKVLRVQEDAGGGTWLLLRQDRAMT